MTDLIGGPTTVVRELERENGRLRVEVERLTAQVNERDRAIAHAERALAAIKDEYQKLRSQLAAARAERDGLREDPRLGITAPDLRAAASFLGMFRDHGGANEGRSAVIDILEPKFRWIADRLAALPPKEADDA